MIKAVFSVVVFGAIDNAIDFTRYVVDVIEDVENVFRSKEDGDGHSS